MEEFPYVVCFPLRPGDLYRCNLVLHTQSFIGELTFESNGMLFMRGETIHAGAANLFTHRVHLYIESSAFPARVDNLTFLVDDEEIKSYFVDGGAPHDELQGSLHHFFV